MESNPTLESWLAALEQRHMVALNFSEVSRAIRALSSLYVERRGRIRAGNALDGAGKRAAFALFYGPLHFLLVRRVVCELSAARPPPARIVDLGCGTGTSGAAWALEANDRPTLLGYDQNPWVLKEARWTYRALGLKGRARRDDLSRVRLRGRREAVLASFTLNELDASVRTEMLGRLLDAARRGSRVLVVEPISRRVAPWWGEWSRAFETAGGRADDWRFAEELPDHLGRLDRAAGLDHRALTARTLWLRGE